MRNSLLELLLLPTEPTCTTTFLLVTILLVEYREQDEDSSSPGRAEQPATDSSSARRAEQTITSLRSAEQPATLLHLKISSIRDVQAWLNGEQIAGCSSADALRIREAVALLSQSKPRQEDVRPPAKQVARGKTEK